MTDLEIARKIQQHVRTSTMTCTRDEQEEILSYCCFRVVELKAAEKEAEPKHDLVLDRLAALEAKFDRHELRRHHWPADGPPINDLDPGDHHDAV
jgi:hypothetical protein